MTQLLIATNNPGKVIELQELLNDLDIELVTPSQIGLDLDVLEDGLTYAENATKKAIAFAQASNLISLADDSGLEVDALNGEPGLYSARYGSTNGEKLSDAERRKYLLSKLQDQPHPWTARFHATIAIAIPKLWSQTDLLSDKPRLQLFEGICPGEIIPAERGSGGFGYDPIFLLPELGKTMAELTMDEKNRLSHRARAVMNAKETLSELLSSR
ncbi:MAG: RdgB/HAM1 family non-canonical purine NTP pyrophosphatase [Chloroflexota bacterium]